MRSCPCPPELLDSCKKLIGIQIPYTINSDFSGKFVITKDRIDFLHYQNAFEYKNELWCQVGNIYWGLGYHSALYYNGNRRLIVVDDELHKNSEINLEYDANNIAFHRARL